MVSLYEINAQELIEKVAKKLKEFPEIVAPEWAVFVKTGMHKQRPPIRKDWWHMRAASVLRWVAIRGPIGVSKLRTKYGGKKNRGMRPDKFFKSSGNILRKVLQQLEAAGLLKQSEQGTHKGRVVTPKGLSVLEKISITTSKKSEVKTEQPKEKSKTEKVAEKPVEKKEETPTEKKEEAKAEPTEEKKETPKAEEKKEEPAKEEKPVESKAEPTEEKKEE